KIVIEALAQGVDAADAVALKRGQGLALGRGDAFEEGTQQPVAALAVTHAFERTAELVGDVEWDLGEVRAAEAGGGGTPAVRAPAHMLGPGRRAQQAVLGVGELGL